MVEEVEESMLDEEPSPDPEKETSCDLSRALLANILSKQNAENVDSSQISHLNLDRQRIQSIPPSVLDDFSSVTNLYLQHNSLVSLEFCSKLQALRFLCVSHNKLESIQGLKDLQALRVLDVSFNLIDSLSLGGLPSSLQFLLVKGNPCAGDESRDDLDEQLRSLPSMIEVDGRRLRGASAYSETKFFSFSESRKKKHASNDRVQQLEEDFQEQIEREIELEKANLLMSEDTHLSNEVQRIKNTIDQTLHDENGKMTNNYVNFRPAVDGLMHHARTQMLNKVDAIKERSRIRRLNTQEYSDEMSKEIAKMKQQLRDKPFKSLSRSSSRPSTAPSRPPTAPS